MSYTFLQEDDKLWRLQECDFFLKDDLDCRLKTLQNPLLVLFYFNDTEKNLLSEWFQISREEVYEKGNLKDFDLKKDIVDEDLDFKVASVNLDYETNLKERFEKIENYNPFHWLNLPIKSGYPFVVFYYQGLPQLLYEGEVNTFVIENEFTSWRENFTDIEKPEVREYLEEILLNNNNKYFEAIADELFIGEKEIKLKKGNLYKITFS